MLKTSRKDIPFFIDTPFARIDSNHRDRIVKKFFRGIENQIFILSTDEEIVGQYEHLMDDAVANKFLLKINAYGYPPCIVTYLRTYLKYPQLEYLVKAGLGKFADSKLILEKIGQDKPFRKWLMANREELIHNY